MSEENTKVEVPELRRCDSTLGAMRCERDLGHVEAHMAFVAGVAYGWSGPVFVGKLPERPELPAAPEGRVGKTQAGLKEDK